MEQQHIIQDIQ